MRYVPLLLFLGACTAARPPAPEPARPPAGTPAGASIEAFGAT